MRFVSVSFLLSACSSSWSMRSATAWVLPNPLSTRSRRGVVVPPSASTTTTTTSASRLYMAIDYNDPVVAEEFNNVQPLSFDEVEAELSEKGIPISPTMNEMEIKLMLVEMRLRLSGKLGGKPKQERPTKFSSRLEEFLWTKPAFEIFYNDLKAKGDNNALNVVTEYIQNPDVALQRYGKDYKGLIRKAEEALNAPPPVNSPTLTFSGFPANMGEQGCLMTLQSLGAIEAFECVQDEDYPILRGTVTFADIESAKAAVAQYNGMDMGMGTVLEIVSA